MLPWIPIILGGLALKVAHDILTDDKDDDYDDDDYYESESQRRQRAELEAKLARERALNQKIDEFKDHFDQFVSDLKEFEKIFLSITQSIDDSQIFSTGEVDKKMINKAFLFFVHDPYPITLSQGLKPCFWSNEVLAFSEYTKLKLYRTDYMDILIDIMDMSSDSIEGIDNMLDMCAKKENELKQEIAQYLDSKSK